MTIYSHSRISTFEQCPLKFKYQYIDEAEVEVEGTAEAFLGSRVHEALEKLYKDLKFQKINSLQQLLDFYNSEWEKNWNDNILIVREEYDKNNFKKMGEKFITDYYNRYAPFDQAKTIGLEMRIEIKLDEKGEYVLQGFIDRLASPKDGIYEIHDYKTANTLPTQDDADTDRQLALYAIAVKEMFSDCKKVILIWHYLAFDKEVRSERSEEQLGELKKEVINAIKQIESTKDFQPNESALCNWCDFRSLCPKFSHLVELEDKKPEEFLADDGVKLVNEYAVLKAEEDRLAKKIDELKEKIFRFAEAKKLDRLYGSDAAVTVWKKDCLKFPVKEDQCYQEFVKLLKLQGLWDDFSILDKYKLQKAFEGGQIDFEKMKELARFASKEMVKRLYLRFTRAN
ncbi:PD-(D/E)XK nuclease family protein [Candidatus Woesearchaeota archaeon]|nr:PD-(D/E)XK nuclease family protein [Candidatus Woesearchaeota archaeon]